MATQRKTYTNIRKDAPALSLRGTKTLRLAARPPGQLAGLATRVAGLLAAVDEQLLGTPVAVALKQILRAVKRAVGALLVRESAWRAPRRPRRSPPSAR